MGRGHINSDYRKQLRERDKKPLPSMLALSTFGAGSTTEKFPTNDHSVKSRKPKKHKRNK